MRTGSIECFLVLAEKLNYTEAAESLFITQSALTKIIQQMEEELGVALFERSRRTVRLTPAGIAFVADGKKILRQYNDGLQRAREAHKGEFGTIRFASHQNNVEPAVLDILSGFRSRYPDILVNIAGMHTSAMVRAIDDGTVDCAVTSGQPVGKSIERIFIRQYRECAVLPKDHPLADRESIDFKELKNEQFIVMSRDYSGRGYNNVTGFSRAAGFSPKIQVSATSVPHLLTELVAANAVSVLSDNYEHMAHGRLRFIPLAGAPLSEIYFLWDTQNPNPCVHTLADHVRGSFGRLERKISHPLNY